MEFCLPLELFRESQAPCRAVCRPCGFFRMMHGCVSAPSCCAFTHRVAFAEGVTSVFSWYSCLSFPTVSSPYLQNLPILPSQKFPSLSIPPSTHSSLSFLTHFICWLAHSLGSPVSLSVALCSPQALPLSPGAFPAGFFKESQTRWRCTGL